MDVDSTLVCLAKGLMRVHGAYDVPGLVRYLEGGAASAQAHVPLRPLARSKVLCALVAQKELSLSCEPFCKRMHILPLHPLFCEPKWRFRSRAFEVAREDHGIFRIEHGLFGWPCEEFFRIVHKVLVECVLAAYEHNAAFLALAAHAPAPLQGCHDAARIAHKDAHIERTYVYAKLKGRGAHHCQKLARGHAGLYVPALLRQIPCPVGRDAPGQTPFLLRDPQAH